MAIALAVALLTRLMADEASRSGGDGASQKGVTVMEQFAAILSGSVRELLGERRLLSDELSQLPQLNSAVTGDALGIHSEPANSENSTKWVQVDLGQERSMDMILLVPALVGVGEYGGKGYGFPRRFRVEIANDPSFILSRVVADFTREDFPNPGDRPVIIRVPGERARHVRVTATRLWKRDTTSVLALGELIVLSGDRNLAVGRPVTASDIKESLPQWAATHLVDGQSVLGLPVEAIPSSANGYHSEERETRQDAVKWVQVDLGRNLPLEEVRLIPARPRDWALVSGFGFPLRFRVEASDDPGFASALVLRSEDATDFRNPGENPVTIPCAGVVARYVRVSATKLWLRTDFHVFALAELEVLSGGTNVSFGSTVQALDSVESGYWSKRALVDGFSSQQRLVPLGVWLEKVARRVAVESRLVQVDGMLVGQVQVALERFLRVLVLAALAIALVGGFLAYRYRLVRLLEMERLRASIATDLHDELGTRLTRLGLLAERAGRLTDKRHPAHSHVEQLSVMTRDMVRAMDEIVWAVNPRNDTLEELAGYLFHFAEEFFRDSMVTCRMDIPADLPDYRIRTEVRHNLLLAVKETLNNVLRHARASNVRVTLGMDGKGVAIEVRDDGCGFDPGAGRSHGNGLRNLRSRMERCGGTVEIESVPDRGTKVRFRVPLPSSG
jgi:signal transduction histidine kinase